MLSKRVWFVVLCALALSVEARAQVGAFDPRSWKKMIAGPRTEVMVLGTLHLGQLTSQRTPQLYRRQYVAWWETRNLRMVANIRAAFGNHPGARVLSIVGASHKPYFDAYLDMMHEVRLVDPVTVLK